MSTLNATPMDPAANSYATLAEANAYFDDRVATGAGAEWAAATDDVKRRALIQATRELDAYVQWLGVATTTTQALAWPRLGIYDPQTGAVVSSTTIPPEIRWAASEQAAALMQGDRAAELAQQVQGVTSLKAGDVALEFKAGGAAARQVLAPAAWALVDDWGRMTQGNIGGARPLVRV